MPIQSSELLCAGSALLDATTPFRDYFRVADHPRSEPLSPQQPPFVNRESHVSTAYRSVARELGRVDKLRGVTEPLKTYELQRVD